MSDAPQVSTKSGKALEQVCERRVDGDSFRLNRAGKQHRRVSVSVVRLQRKRPRERIAVGVQRDFLQQLRTALGIPDTGRVGRIIALPGNVIDAILEL